MGSVRIAVALAFAVVTISACQKQSAAFAGKSSKSVDAECLSSGGRMVKGPLRRGPAVCVHLFADRGKVCRDKKECEGECRYTDRSMFADPETQGSALWNEEASRGLPSVEQIGKEAVGHCQWSDDDESGCSAAIVGGKLQDWSCID